MAALHDVGGQQMLHTAFEVPILDDDQRALDPLSQRIVGAQGHGAGRLAHGCHVAARRNGARGDQGVKAVGGAPPPVDGGETALSSSRSS